MTTATTTTTTTLLDIPDDCWKQILSYIDNIDNPLLPIHQNNRKSLSSTCKHLLYATNRLPYSLPVTTQLISHPHLLRRILHRFSSSLHCLKCPPLCRDVDASLSLLAAEDATRSLRRLLLPFTDVVPINGLRRFAEVCSGLKLLDIYGCCTLSDDYLIEICNLFCLIEEIDVSDDEGGSLSDVGIVYLAKKLKSLKKIHVSGHPNITDESLVALSDHHCLSLSDVDVRQCSSVTQHGVGYMLRHCSKLEHLAVTIAVADSSLPLSCSIKDSVGFSRSLSTLELFEMDVEDSLLVSLARAKLPLKKFSIYYCQKFTLQGLAAFLGAYPNLEGLDFRGTMFLTDKVVEGLVCYFKRLSVIKLGCCELTEATFYLLVKCCSVLEEVWMEDMLREGEFSGVLVQSLSINYLSVTGNSGLTDEKLQAIGLMCPNLVHLDVAGCCKLTSKGIGGVLESCCEIKYLSVVGFSDSKLFDMDLECPRFKIEQLQLTASKINDDCLSAIAKACPNLMFLDLSNCSGITSTGLTELVSCCTRLKNIRVLEGCPSICPDIVRWMVLARPSLKKIVARSKYSPSSSDEEVFFNHGCSVKVYDF